VHFNILLCNYFNNKYNYNYQYSPKWSVMPWQWSVAVVVSMAGNVFHPMMQLRNPDPTDRNPLSRFARFANPHNCAPNVGQDLWLLKTLEMSTQ